MLNQRTVLDDTPVCCAPVVREPLSDASAGKLSRVLKALGDPVRLRLLSMIGAHQGGEACVCDLLDAFDLTPPTISHHLKVLRKAGLVEAERRGTWVYYRVRSDLLARLGVLFTPVDVGQERPAESVRALDGDG